MMGTGGTDVVADRPSSAPAPEHPPDRVVLRATGITKTFSRGMWPRRRALPVLRGAHLELRRGEIAGLVGENGSGKSTLMKILSGRFPETADACSASDVSGSAPRNRSCTSD